MPHASDFSHLSAAECIHLVQELWESIHDKAQAMKLTAEERAEIERRHAELESGAVQGIPLERMRQSLLSRR
jgi:putative addiction module component (TIGR02574 family)